MTNGSWYFSLKKVGNISSEAVACSGSSPFYGVQ